MNVAVCCKFVPDIQDMSVNAQGGVDFAKAKWEISEFDLQAVQAGVDLANATDGKVVAVSVGPNRVNNTQLRKDLLSRGPEELYLVADDALAGASSGLTSAVLAEVVRRTGADVIICGEGSADLYSQQTGTQLAARLGIPSLTCVDGIDVEDGRIVVERLLEGKVQKVAVDAPVLLSVTPSINTPMQPTMRQILSAGKKPCTVLDYAELADLSCENDTAVVEEKALSETERKGVVISASTLEEAAAELVVRLKAESVL